MNIVVRRSQMVKPAQEGPNIKLWISNLDSCNHHVKFLYFYTPASSVNNFFDPKVMKAAQIKVLVPFYPIAGRLKEDTDCRIKIDCQGQGVLFVEAESDGVINDFGDFAPRVEYLKLIPSVDYSSGIESYPLLIVQVTYFQCGGIALGVGIHHRVADGLSMMHFINSWSEMARGLDLTLPPLNDRTLLRARDPPMPVFEHIEYQPSPSMKFPLLKSSSPDETITNMFKITKHQVNLLKKRSKEDGNTINFSSFEVLAAHIWMSMSKARGLPDEQETKIRIPTDGRTRLQPTLPPGYFGNVVFPTTSTAKSSELLSNPTWYVASKIHDAIKLRNNDYLNSAIDYYELQLNLKNNFSLLARIESPNVMVNDWTKLHIYEADFGWGRPIFMVPAWLPIDGLSFILPSPIDDGSILIVTSLQPEHMKLFSKLIYDI